MILVLDTSAKNITIGTLNEGEETNKLEFEAGRGLDSVILEKIDELIQHKPKDLTGIIVNTGPGSFTGLRIGLSVANSLAYGLNIPITGVAKIDSWENLIKVGLKEIKNKNSFEKPVIAEYGAEPNITKPKEK